MSNTSEADHDPVPSPSLAAALWAAGQCPPERLPWWAAHWLTRDGDGDAVRALAGLDGSDPAAVRDLVPEVFAELSVTVPDSAAAAADLVFGHVARTCLEGRAEELWVARKVEKVIICSEYSQEVLALPLGTLYGVDDEWQGGWGRSEAELRTAVRDACAAQLQAGGTP